MTNFFKLSLLKQETKNFTSNLGRKIYTDTLELMQKVVDDPKHENSEEVTTFINKNNFFIKKFL